MATVEVHSLKAEAGAENISVGNYLLTRLAQLHVTVRNTYLFPLSSFNLLHRRCLVFRVISTWRFW